MCRQPVFTGHLKIDNATYWLSEVLSVVCCNFSSYLLRNVFGKVVTVLATVRRHCSLICTQLGCLGVGVGQLISSSG